MNKRILIPLMVCVLAIGTMGAAFATTMTVTGVGALSEGEEAVPTINADGVSYNLDNYGSVTSVDVSLDQNVATGTEIVVRLRGDIPGDGVSGDVDVTTGKTTLTSAQAASAWINVPVVTDDRVEYITSVRVTVAQ